MTQLLGESMKPSGPPLAPSVSRTPPIALLPFRVKDNGWLEYDVEVESVTGRRTIPFAFRQDILPGPQILRLMEMYRALESECQGLKVQLEKLEEIRQKASQELELARRQVAAARNRK